MNCTNAEYLSEKFILLLALYILLIGITILDQITTAMLDTPANEVSVAVASFIIFALFVEAIVQTLKAIWGKTTGKITVAKIVSIGIGVVIAVVAKINFLAGWLM